MSNPKMKFVAGSLVIVVALGWLGFVGFQKSKSYYITVDEFRAMEGKYHGKTLKVAGDVVEGTINRSKTPLEFIISHDNHLLQLKSYEGIEVIKAGAFLHRLEARGQSR